MKEVCRDADPATLSPLNIRASSKRYIELIGGRDAVYAAAKVAADAGDHQWAAELVSHLVRVDPEDTEARLLKADALRTLGYGTPNSNWRNFYLTAARELDGTIDYSLGIQINAPDQIAAMPGSALLDSLRFRIDPEKAGTATATAGIHVSDTGEDIGLIIRNGVLEVSGVIPSDASFVLQVPKQAVAGMIFLDTLGVLQKALDGGAASFSAGGPEDAAAFFAYFEPHSDTHITLANR
ncbi:alkyl sulfatase dimerization domain-containing protein [Subtercola lobariae]|uniref:alkyl sulfatase dimerization domain-containing protein n=1 Tax=Subtercola lobariae TaxID=1588641 RepID=UPI00166CE020|nr:alkyl sulfatase dimerization domain-containing protein [Subtercola lobariae]